MSTVIAATDGSPSGTEAVLAAIAEATASESRLDIVSAWKVPVEPEFRSPYGMTRDVIFAHRDAMAETLERAKSLAAGAGVDAETHLVDGDPADEVCRLAEERGAGLIVMGSRGHGPLAGALVGSVAARVLKHATCPVLVVRAEPT